MSYRSEACNTRREFVPYTNHQDHNEPASAMNVKHHGTCTEFLLNLQELSKKSPESHTAPAFEKYWLEENTLPGGLNKRGVRMRICVGDCTPFTAEDIANGRNDNDNLCEGEVICINKANGMTTMEGPDKKVYYISQDYIASFE